MPDSTPQKQPVRLGALAQEHWQLVRQWAQMPELKEYFRRYPPLHVWGHDIAAAMPGAYLIFAGDTAVGLVHLFNVDAQARKGEFGILIDGTKVAKRAPVAVSAMRQVAEYAFDYLGLNKLYCRVLPHRDDLVRLLSTYRFKPEAHFRDEVFFEGRFHDEIQLSLLAKEF